MQALDEVIRTEPAQAAVSLPISVIVPARNESRNLARCLSSLRGCGEVFVIDSQSQDDTVEIARACGAQVVQFHYHGGWPKKRQWALDTLPVSYEWVLLLDADEAITPELKNEIREAIRIPQYDGYYIELRMHFLGRRLRRTSAGFYKLSLFRRSKGHFERRLEDQDSSMGDAEVHEHVVVAGKTGKLKNAISHHNVESLSRYIRKHDEYSNWEAQTWLHRDATRGDLPPSFFGNQAQRRRWLKTKFLRLPTSPALFFLYKYFLRFGFLDGVPGLIYCGFQAIQFFHIKAKIYEAKMRAKGAW